MPSVLFRESPFYLPLRRCYYKGISGGEQVHILQCTVHCYNDGMQYLAIQRGSGDKPSNGNVFEISHGVEAAFPQSDENLRDIASIIIQVGARCDMPSGLHKCEMQGGNVGSDIERKGGSDGGLDGGMDGGS